MTRLQQARAAVFVAFAIQGLTFASLITRLESIATKLDLSAGDVFVVLGVTTAVGAVGSVVAGHLATRIGSAASLSIMLAGASLAAVVPAFAPSMATLLALIGFYGFFLGGVDASMNMQGTATQDAYARPLMNGFHAMWSAAAVLGAVYATVTIALGVPLGLDMIPIAIVGLVANAGTFRLLLPPEAVDAVEERTSSTDAPRPRLPWLPLLLVAVPTFAMWFIDSAASAWGGIYVVDGLGAVAAAGPAIYAGYQLVLLAVRLPGDRLVARFGPERVIRTGGIVGVGALVLIVAAPHWVVAAVGFAILGGSLAMVPPQSFVAAAHISPDNAEEAIARVNLANYAGYLAAASLIAAVAEIFGERSMFVIPLAVCVLIPLMARRFATRPAPQTVKSL
ncbi:MFS family permease [Nocardioides luteus]|uniref:MFS transporter n=1 Tax=Nocardioides luteus TaxID=1844 RepID=A0ABQ5T2B5_9ACTN|nr:MFS transporter [Nocardioides luteus]MDR7311585.1 MFS family permease [Nocardioides luteus]GGR54598.1 MFS transporter [Nocardioides luteus]GLJ70234.1 MFS transporter [Nocardioides luteus]